jgi:uncharacterized protein (DUF885 family)
LRDGDDFYQNRIKHHTNLTMSADQIHEFGKAGVASIHKEMRDIMENVGFEGNLQNFFRFVRTDPNNFCANSDVGR